MRNANLFKIALAALTLAMLATVLAFTSYGANPTPADEWQWLKLKTEVVVPPVTPPTVKQPVPKVLRALDLPADSQPSPMTAVGAVLKALNPQPDEVLVDFGCGFDARYLITACRLYGTKRAIGIEIDPKIADSARRYVAHAGLSDRITIITADSTKFDVTADIGVAYLWPETLEQLRPRIEQLSRFASYSHPVPGWESVARPGDVYLYAKRTPPKIQYARPAAAVWNGRTYTHRVCGNPRCTMCASIEAQLETPVPVAQPAARSGHWEDRKQCTTDWRGRKTCQTVKVWVQD